MIASRTVLQRLKCSSNGIARLDDDELEVAFYDYIDERDMMGPDRKGRLVFREIFARWRRARRNPAVADELTQDEAVAECERWLAHLEHQRQKTKRIQELAVMARQGPEQQKEAQRKLRQIDRQPHVYDGANLEKAVRCLLEER